MRAGLFLTAIFVRKALAVKLVYQGYKYEEIQTILDVSLGSITSWKH